MPHLRKHRCVELWDCPVSWVDRADRFQRRHGWASFPVAVVYKFYDDQGGFLVALITYYGFLSLIAAVAWQLLQAVGTYYVGHKLKRSTDVYGLFGIVLGLFTWIYLEAAVVVLCAEVNVVRACRLWPRALLTPFTDTVRLTGADRRAYTSYAEMRRHKSYERIEVSFDQPPGADATERSPEQTS